MAPSVRNAARAPRPAVVSLHALTPSCRHAACAQPAEKEPMSVILQNAAKKAAGGGIAGAVAMFVNVGTLM